MEEKIFEGLLSNDEYTRKVFPYLKHEYFTGSEQIVFSIYSKYFNKYNTLPTKDILLLELKKEEVPEKLFIETKNIIQNLKGILNEDIKWLIDRTEDFCKEKAIYNALVKSIDIVEGNAKDLLKTSIPDLLSTALSVEFNSKLGHDYFLDAAERYDKYAQKTDKIPFHIEILNKITNGGVEKKTLNVIIGATNSGKSVVLCDLAAGYLKKGKNVLYITLEMAEEKIARRIDANLLNCEYDLIERIPREIYIDRLEKLYKKYGCKIHIKEYPPSVATSNDFKILLKELKQKRNFVPDIILVDYITICASSRIKNKGDPYTYYKSVAEEIRALAVEYDLPIWTGAQFNRNGQDHSNPDLNILAESHGISMSSDFMICIITSEEFDELDKMPMKQLKSRYGDKNLQKILVIGYDRPKMKLYDLKDDELNKEFAKPNNNSVLDNNLDEDDRIF